MSKYITDARFQREKADGSIEDYDAVSDLDDVLHPLQKNTTPISPTGIKVNGVDVCNLYEPIASGLPPDLPTGFKVNGVDLQQLFCGKGRILSGLRLGVLPRGSFTCDTFFKMFLDTSGSMNVALSYVRPAAATLSNFFRDVVYGDSTGARRYMLGYQNLTNEYCVSWMSYTLDRRNTSSNPPKEISMAFINESNSKGLGSSQAYVNRWNAVNNLGGTKYSAIGGVELPGYPFAEQLRRRIDGEPGQEEGRYLQNNHALKDYGMTGFFNITNATKSDDYVQMIVKWLNIPTEPIFLQPKTHVSDVTSSTIKWTFEEVICGLTHKPSGNSTGYVRTQKSWRVQVSTTTSETGLVYSKEHSSLPTTYTLLVPAVEPDYEAYVISYDDLRVVYAAEGAPNGQSMVDWGKEHYIHNGSREGRTVPNKSNITGTKFYCRLSAIGETGYPSTHSSWVLNTKKNHTPEITLNGPSNIEIQWNKPWTDPWATCYDTDDGMLQVTRSGHFDHTVPGSYTLTYTATDSSGASVSVNRVASVVNHPPVITLRGDSSITV